MEPKDIKRIVYSGIVILIIIISLITNFIRNTRIKKEGYNSYKEYIAEQNQNQIKEKYKTVKIYSDNSINEDSLLVKDLKDAGYKVTLSNIPDASILDGSFSFYTRNTELTIINCGLYNDYVKYVETELEENLNEELGVDLTSLIYAFPKSVNKDNFVLIIGPDVKYQEDVPSVRFSYDEIVEKMLEICEEKGVKYVDAYHLSNDNPVPYTLEGIGKFDNKLEQYISEETVKHINDLYQKYCDNIK